MNAGVNKELKEIYSLMYERNGYRDWWPADTKFEVIVGAILTQFVSWKNVKTAIENLVRENLLSIEGICNAETEKLEDMVRSTRFYKQKARKLKEFCYYINEKYNADLDSFLDRDVYELRKELLSLYGIGEETADSIILYAAEKPIFVVDAYTKRIFGRLGYFKDDITYGEMQKFFMDNLEKDVGLFNDFHAQIVGVGNQYCNGKKPDCKGCSLDSICRKCGLNL